MNRSKTWCINFSEWKHRRAKVKKTIMTIFRSDKEHGCERPMALLHKPDASVAPHRQVRGTRRRCSGCGFRGQQCSDSCYHSGQNQSLNWRASPSPRINWGVLMDSEWINWWLSYFAVLTQCALTTQHTHLQVHHCGAMQIFTPISWFASFCKKKSLVINLASSDNIKLQNANSLTCVYFVTG